MPHTVILPQPIHPDGLARLEARPDLVRVQMTASPSTEDVRPHLQGADAVLLRNGLMDRAMIEAAPRLKIISRHGIGLDNIDLQAAAARGVTATHVGRANVPSVVEHTFALMLTIAKDVYGYDEAIRAGRFSARDSLRAFDLMDKTLLVIGLGRIGGDVVQIARAFGMRVLGADIAMDDAMIAAKGALPANDWRERLSEVDILTVHVPLKDDTRALIDGNVMAAMKPTAVIINCARGGIVDEAALISALDGGRLFMAGLDVQACEPTRADDPLLTNTRVVLTPHMAASTGEGMRRMSLQAAQNIIDYFDGVLDETFIANGVEPPRSPLVAT
ncbi:MAG: hydroxyacid dehydrogenase [Pseudomonadota bacterium]